MAAFVLGGTWFRRLPWLYTALILLGTLFVIVITGCFGVGYYISQHSDLIQKVKAAAETHNMDAMFSLVKPLFYYTVTAVLTVLSMVMLWLSYRLFCRRQLQSQRILMLKS